MAASRLVTLRLGAWSLATVLIALSVCAHGQTSDEALAQRFRPYIKTTLSGGKDEPYHPATWQWIVVRSNLFRGSDVVTPYTQFSNDLLALANPALKGNFSVDNAGMSDPQLTLSLASADAVSGEPWQDVIHQGHGLYAHVEHIPQSPLVNIEYTILWPRNDAIGSHHDGDITTMVVVYDSQADLVSRVTYSIHGCLLLAYGLTAPASVSFENLGGRDEHMQPSQTEAIRVEISDSQAGTDRSGLCSGAYSSEQHLFFVRDPQTQRFEHPVAFAENSAHELWPNASGFLSLAPAHDGDGVSFLPDSVHVLGTLQAPTMVDFPFLFYNGKFGDDPQAIVLHKTWYWPCGRDKNPWIAMDRFSDSDPYQKLGSLPWPPTVPVGFAGTIRVSPREAGPASPFEVVGSRPMQGLAVAATLAPSGSTLQLGPGHYRESLTLGRPMTLVAEGGVVILGQMNP